ncbi:MAG: MgtC/SapB family protein [Firmicutes bacterium]|nr:MgtC/SapB family protein [Bacillota bacterium]
MNYRDRKKRDSLPWPFVWIISGKGRVKINYEFLVRLTVATLLGSIIGWEREKQGRPAGLRTHILVALGSCLMMLISIYGFSGVTARDPARLAAQVVSGIGFLGAGNILREGTSIRGLTTAASLWVVAGIGLACGTALYLAAVAATIVAFLVLVLLDDLELKIKDFSAVRVRVEVADQPGMLSAFTQIFGNHGINIKKIQMKINSENKIAHISLQIRGHNIDKEKIIEEISLLPGVYSVEWN